MTPVLDLSVTALSKSHLVVHNSIEFQCFYIGALPESATSIMNEVSKPLSWSMPPEKVCEKLRTKDAQICELKYGQ